MDMQKMLSKETSTRTRLAYYGLLYHSDGVTNMCEGIRRLNLCLLRFDRRAEAMKLLAEQSDCKVDTQGLFRSSH
jgi:hypothetical protein